MNAFKRIKRVLPLVILVLTICVSCTRTPILYLAGDSTMSYKPDSVHPERGWGMLLPEYFNENVVVENHAKNGRSTRSFIYEGLWDSLMTRVTKGDYVVIQFGHNDGSEKKVRRYTVPEEYQYNLTKFIQETRAKGAYPILCTPIQRRKFDSTGFLVNSHGVYPDIVRSLASEFEVPLIDMQARSDSLIKGYGVQDSKNIFLHYAPGKLEVLPEGLVDNTHFSEMGARLMAGLFVDGLKELHHPLTKYLKEEE